LNQLNHFIGVFHPMLVHLPIGFLLLGILFYWLSFHEKFKNLIFSVRFIYLLGSIAAAVSCISGWCLSNTTFYEEQLLNYHQWLGITLAVLSFTLYALFNKIATNTNRILTVVIIIVLCITGHLGATLTHGEFSFNAKAENRTANHAAAKQPIIQNMNEAIVYKELIQPIFQDNCYNCHGASKQKGNLRLDETDWIVKGGKAGAVLIPNDAAKSILYQRLMLEEFDKKHMPPKSEPPLTKNQINLIHWWIASGASFDKKVKELNPTAKEQKILAEYAKPLQSMQFIEYYPAASVAAPDKKTMEQLTNLGIAVVPVANNSNYLEVDFLSNKNIPENIWLWLEKLKDQIVSIKIKNNELNAISFNTIAKLQNLHQLHLPNCKFKEADLITLQKLKNIQILNIVGTNISAKGIESLLRAMQVKKLFMYQTNLSSAEKNNLIKLFNTVKIDTGNYHMTILESDTALVKMSTK
jgi:uncharacterized membrane protein